MFKYMMLGPLVTEKHKYENKNVFSSEISMTEAYLNHPSSKVYEPNEVVIFGEDKKAVILNVNPELLR